MCTRQRKYTKSLTSNEIFTSLNAIDFVSNEVITWSIGRIKSENKEILISVKLSAKFYYVFLLFIKIKLILWKYFIIYNL